MPLLIRAKIYGTDEISRMAEELILDLLSSTGYFLSEEEIQVWLANVGSEEQIHFFMGGLDRLGSISEISHRAADIKSLQTMKSTQQGIVFSRLFLT